MQARKYLRDLKNTTLSGYPASLSGSQAPLCLIHFAIGVPNQDVHGDRLRRIEDGQAQADTDRFGHLRQPNAGKRRIQSYQALLPSLQWTLRQDRGKFISAYSKHHVDLSKRLGHDIPDRRENPVSGLVTML